MRTMTFKSVMAASAALALCGSAHAAELQVSVVYGAFDPGATETFDIDTSVMGTLSPTSTAAFGSAEDADFTITNDSLGNTLLQVGDSDDDNYFATATSDFSAFFTTPTVTNATSQQFYDGSSLFPIAAPGETATGDDGTSISITSAVSAAPEPSTWLLMFAGIASIGLMLRRAKTTMGFRFKDAFSV